MILVLCKYDLVTALYKIILASQYIFMILVVHSVCQCKY